ncbi:MAG: Mrp/NBP35 family ATP-binding protein [Desulfovibrionaceae bacterium]|nr:Mrp/NBP35 family ATP-binding protein [Desulfovibrionaceae bacterium]
MDTNCGHSQPDKAISLDQAIKEKAVKDTLAGIKNKIFVVSGKGGVGKSSVTVNLAAALAQKGLKVGVLDVDFHGPSIPRLLGTAATLTANEAGKLIPVPCINNISMVSVDALRKERDSAIIWRGPIKSGVIRQFLSDVAWGPLDVLLIDSPPGTGDEHLTVLDTIPDAAAVLVTTPQEVSLQDVRKALNFLKLAKAPILGIVENMSGLICPHCGKTINIFRKGGGQELAIKELVPFLGAVPLDPLTVVAADKGVPAVNLKEDSPAKTAFLAIAEKIMKKLK